MWDLKDYVRIRGEGKILGLRHEENYVSVEGEKKMASAKIFFLSQTSQLPLTCLSLFRTPDPPQLV